MTITEPIYSEPVARLLGLDRPVDPWPDYSSEYGLTVEHTTELTRMAADENW